MPSLKKAIVQYTEKNYGRTIDPANVIVSDVQAFIFNVLYALINPGNQVIVLAPYW